MGDKALVVGASGISGSNVARLLRDNGWEVHGLARRPPEALDGIVPVLVDLNDGDAVRRAIEGGRYTHAFYCTWSRQPTEAENCVVNGRMLEHVLAALERDGTLRHVALVTGLKHYQGPFEAYAKHPRTAPFREEMERLPYENFYYTLEDILYNEAARAGFTWSVHRAHTLIGCALGNAMNMGVTLSVYSAICRELDRPFVFPGSPVAYAGVNDMTDAELLAEQMLWAATSPAADNQAFNAVNGDVFRWRTLWETIAEALDVATGPYPGHGRSLEDEMREMDPVWERIVERHGLQRRPLAQLVSWWHTDSDLGREVESFADSTKARAAGFHGFRRTDDSWRTLIERLRRARIVP